MCGKGISCISYCLVHSFFMFSLFWIRISGCGCFLLACPTVGVCGVSVFVMLMGGHVFGWSWFLLFVCVGFGFAGACADSFWWAGR